MTDNIQTKIGQIKAVFPQEIETLHTYDNGDDFIVIEVNQKWMFRFPRNASAKKALRCENLFLPKFVNISPLPIPQLSNIHEDFVCYRKIEGVPLTNHLFRTLHPEIQCVIAKQIGEFLSALHAFPVNEAREIGLTEGWGGWREKAYQCFMDDVAPRLSVTACRNAMAFFDQFFALQYKRVVVHGDFCPGDHVFFDVERQKLCGVIDFGDLTIEDAATDLHNIFEDFGEGFLQQVIAYYSRETDTGLFTRIMMRIRAHPLFDASYALEYDFEERFQKRLSEIEVVFG